MAMKLIYFNARGVVEVSRYMLHIAGAEYEDFRFPIDIKTFKKDEADAAKVSRERGSLRARWRWTGGER